MKFSTKKSAFYTQIEDIFVEKYVIERNLSHMYIENQRNLFSQIFFQKITQFIEVLDNLEQMLKINDLNHSNHQKMGKQIDMQMDHERFLEWFLELIKLPFCELFSLMQGVCVQDFLDLWEICLIKCLNHKASWVEYQEKLRHLGGFDSFLMCMLWIDDLLSQQRSQNWRIFDQGQDQDQDQDQMICYFLSRCHALVLAHQSQTLSDHPFSNRLVLSDELSKRDEKSDGLPSSNVISTFEQASSLVKDLLKFSGQNLSQKVYRLSDLLFDDLLNVMTIQLSMLECKDPIEDIDFLLDLEAQSKVFCCLAQWQKGHDDCRRFLFNLQKKGAKLCLDPEHYPLDQWGSVFVSPQIVDLRPLVQSQSAQMVKEVLTEFEKYSAFPILILCTQSSDFMHSNK